MNDQQDRLESEPTVPVGSDRALPSAVVASGRGVGWMMLIPLVALIVAGTLWYFYMIEKGPVIHVRFEAGHGLEAGDSLRCRGIEVGVVESVGLTADFNGVDVAARLRPESEGLARSGARFWIVRPRVSLTEVGGLETLAGSRYIAVLPPRVPDDAKSASGVARQAVFIGLEDPPVLATEPPGGLEVSLWGPRRASLDSGAPVMFRQVRVGTIVSAGLSSDSQSVIVRAYIRPTYRNLVRSNSRFWIISGGGLEWDLFSGLDVEMDSLETILDGGVAFATPEDPGDPVNTGHRFELAGRADEDWLSWRPSLAVGPLLLNGGLPGPPPVRATVIRRRRGFFGGEVKEQEFAWLIPVTGGLLAPRDFLRPGSSEQGIELEVAGQTRTLDQPPPSVNEHLALLSLPAPTPGWPSSLIRRPESPEDCVIVGDPSVAGVPLASGWITAVDGQWRIDRSRGLLRDSWHGAAVVGRRDGKLLGVLLIQSDRTVVSLIPSDLSATDD